MKKFIVSLLLTAGLSLLAGFYLPWWSIALAAFVVSVLIPQRAGVAFISGFLAVFLLWFVFAFMISSSNGHLLGRKIAMVVLKTGSAAALIFLSALTGALVAGFAALTGSYTRKRPVVVVKQHMA